MAIFSKFFQSSNPPPLIQSSPTLHTGSEWTPADSDNEPPFTTTTKTLLTWHEALSLAFSQKGSESLSLGQTSLSSVTLTFSDGSKMQAEELVGNPLELLLRGKNLTLKAWHPGGEKGSVVLPNGSSLHVKDKRVSYTLLSTFCATT